MSNRQVIDGGRWFDLDKAQSWEEETRWDGHNEISLATGSQWEHEVLYQTAGGIWILHHTSQWQGSSDSWHEIEAGEAAVWLVLNEHEDDVPDELASAVASLEVA